MDFCLLKFGDLEHGGVLSLGDSGSSGIVKAENQSSMNTSRFAVDNLLILEEFVDREDCERLVSE